MARMVLFDRNPGSMQKAHLRSTHVHRMVLFDKDEGGGGGDTGLAGMV